MEDLTENLFSYGTLQTEPVQRSVFGRSVEGTPDFLVGYLLVMSQIRDPDFIAKHGDAKQRNVQHTGITSDVVEGTVLKLSQKELELGDQYKPTEYERRLVQLRSGVSAWVYLNNSGQDNSLL